MGRKVAENRYGVQAGDIFSSSAWYDGEGSYSFYQVVALRGETQVEVRKIGKETIAFDGVYEGVVPVPDSWVSDESIVRRVADGAHSVSIKISDGNYAYLEKKKIYLEGHMCPNHSYILRTYNPELSRQLDLSNGSGIYAADGFLKGLYDDCRAIVRYPDGRQEEAKLKELLRWEGTEEYQRYEAQMRRIRESQV